MLTLILSIWFPVIAWQSTESVKKGQSKLLGPTAVILLSLAGQIAMAGFIIPALFVPLYAYVTYKRVSQDCINVHTSPSPTEFDI